MRPRATLRATIVVMRCMARWHRPAQVRRAPTVDESRLSGFQSKSSWKLCYGLHMTTLAGLQPREICPVFHFVDMGAYADWAQRASESRAMEAYAYALEGRRIIRELTSEPPFDHELVADALQQLFRGVLSTGTAQHRATRGRARGKGEMRPLQQE